MTECTFSLNTEKSYKNKLLSLSIKDNNDFEYPLLFIDLSADWSGDGICNIIIIAERYGLDIWIQLQLDKESGKIFVYFGEITKDHVSRTIIALPSDISNEILEKYLAYHSYSYEY